MHRLIDILYRIGFGIFICWALYKLFLTLLPAIFQHFGGKTGGWTIWGGVGMIIVLGPLLSWKGADWLLQSVSHDQPSSENEA